MPRELQRLAFARGFRAGRRWRAKEVRALAKWLDAELHELREEILRTARTEEWLRVLQDPWLEAEDSVLH